MSIEFPLPQVRVAPFGDRIRVRTDGSLLPRAGAVLARLVMGKSWAGRAARVAVVIASLGVSAFSAGQGSTVSASAPRGYMYDVGGGRRMRLVCEGPSDSSKPTVLFESGAFGFSGDWAHVQKQLTAQGVHSCAYDRAGMGLSDPSDLPRDGVNVAKDLEKLLSVAHVDGPLILVGHSMAGARVHLFANRNPGRTAGLVLVDSTTPEALDNPTVRQYIAGFTAGAHAAARTAPFGILRLLSYTQLGDKVGLPPQEDIEKRWQFGDPGYEHTSYVETKNWPLAAAQARETGPLNPKWPVAVVSAGVVEGEEGPAMQGVQPAPALASEHGYVSVVDGATHNGLLGAKYSPAIVQGIDFVLKEATAAPGEYRPGITLKNTIVASR